MDGTLQPGAEFAGFRIEEVVARGGMGVVYRATQLRTGRRVALKCIAPERAADPAYRVRFLREASVLATLEHPRIVPLYDYGDADGLLYFAMRYVAGSDLHRRISIEGRLDPGTTLELLGPVAEALDYAHRRGYVHRDVKPENILIDPDGNVYLTDFGLGKQLGAGSGLSSPGMALGTLGYMAPEQFTGERLDPDLAGRTDLYALGCVLHACLIGTEPYPRDSFEAAMYAHVHAEPPRIAGLRPDLPVGLDVVIATALAKRPADRYATAGALAAAARSALAGPVRAPQAVETRAGPTSEQAPTGPRPTPGGETLAATVAQPVGLPPAPVATPAAAAPQAATPVPAPISAAAAPPGVVVPAPAQPAPARRLSRATRIRLLVGLAGVALIVGAASIAVFGGGSTIRPRPSVAPATGAPTAVPGTELPTLPPETPAAAWLPPDPLPVAAADPEAHLRAYIPAEMQASSTTDTTGQSGPRFYCQPEADVIVVYLAETSWEVLESDWRAMVAAAGGGLGIGRCDADPVAEGTWQRGADGAPIGRILCARADATYSDVSWTVDGGLVVAVLRAPGTPAEVYARWAGGRYVTVP